MAASFICKDLKKPIIVCSLFRPTDNNLDYSQELCSVLYSRFRDHILWIGGDANLPDIDWKTDTVTRHNYTASINQLFSDTFSDIGCEQIVDFPTRIDNTVDIFGTNRPYPSAWHKRSRCLACGLQCSSYTQEASKEKSLPVEEGKQTRHGRRPDQVH